MYVAITGSGKYRVIQFREDKRIPGTKKKKAHVIKTIGNYEQMLAEDPEIIAKLKEELNPEIMRVVFKDSGFADDVVKTNAIQILKQAGIEDVRSL